MRKGWIWLALAGLLVAACSGNPGPGHRPGELLVEVENRSWHDVRIYTAPAAGMPVRLGYVRALRTERLRVPCAPFLHRRTDFWLRPLAGRAERLWGEPVGDCSDVLRVVVGAGGLQYSTVSVRRAP